LFLGRRGLLLDKNRVVCFQCVAIDMIEV